MSAVIAFKIPGLPVAWARAGHHGAVSFTPKKQRNFMAELKDVAEQAMQGRAPLDGPLMVECVFAWPWPRAMSARKRGQPGAKWRTSRPDADNLIKLVGDALNGVVWRDDAIIAIAHGWKMHGDAAETRVRVRTLA